MLGKDIKDILVSYNSAVKVGKLNGDTKAADRLAGLLAKKGYDTSGNALQASAKPVEAFNSAFSQPSLLSSPTTLSAGDQLALGMQPSTGTADSGLNQALAGTTTDQTIADAAARDAASAQQAADMQAFSAASAQSIRNNSILGDVVGSQGASFEVANGQINPVGTAVNEQLAAAASDALQAKTRVATTGLDIGKGVVEDTLRTRVRRGIASTITAKQNLSAPLLEKPTLLG